MTPRSITLKAPNGREWEQPTGLFINNEFVESTNPENVITSIDPATEKEIATYKEIVQEASAKSSVIKKNEALAADDKSAQLKAISEEKNAKIKELLGADRSKNFNKLRKDQKVAEEALIADYKQ